MPGSERGDEGERQDKPRKGHEDVGDAHQHAVGPAAEIARRGADDEAEHRRRQRHQRDDGERRACAVDDAAPDVAAELIGPEQVPPCAGRQQAVLQHLCVRVMRGQQRRQRGHENQCDDDDEAKHRQRVPREAEPGEVALHGACLQPRVRRVRGQPGAPTRPAGLRRRRSAHAPVRLTGPSDRRAGRGRRTEG